MKEILASIALTLGIMTGLWFVLRMKLKDYIPLVLLSFTFYWGTFFIATLLKLTYVQWRILRVVGILAFVLVAVTWIVKSEKVDLNAKKRQS